MVDLLWKLRSKTNDFKLNNIFYSFDFSNNMFNSIKGQEIMKEIGPLKVQLDEEQIKAVTKIAANETLKRVSILQKQIDDLQRQVSNLKKGGKNG